MLHAHLKGYPTRGLTLIAHAVLLALCGAASAQETPAQEAPAPEAPAQEAPTGELQAEATTVGLETVVVTAQKKAENLQVVPISVAAVTGQDIADLQASRLDSLAGTVPNVQIGTFSNTPNTASIYIRGIGVNEPDPYAGNTVSIVTDGVPQFFSMGALLDLHDVERIEVLRGPQGTLFGANTTGGVVNVVNAQPQREFGGKFDVSYGDWEHTTVGLVLTGPLSDTISGRIGFRNDRREGWIKDVVDGSTIGDRDVSVFRGALKFEPSDNFDATITAEYDRARNGSPAVVAGNRPGDAALGIPADVEFVPAGWRDMYVSPCPPDGGQLPCAGRLPLGGQPRRGGRACSRPVGHGHLLRQPDHELVRHGDRRHHVDHRLQGFQAVRIHGSGRHAGGPDRHANAKRAAGSSARNCAPPSSRPTGSSC